MSRTVLLVDDDAAVREALAQTLELADIDVDRGGVFCRGQGPDYRGV